MTAASPTSSSLTAPAAATAYFFDTSALVKRYVAESGTNQVLVLTSSEARIYIARITAAELVAALANKRRLSPGSKQQISRGLRRFRREYNSYAFLVVEIDATLVDYAMNLAEKHELRGYDAVQLAAVLRANAERLAIDAAALTLVCADGDLTTAAKAEGLSVVIPADVP